MRKGPLTRPFCDGGLNHRVYQLSIGCLRCRSAPALTTFRSARSALKWAYRGGRFGFLQQCAGPTPPPWLKSSAFQFWYWPLCVAGPSKYVAHEVERLKSVAWRLQLSEERSSPGRGQATEPGRYAQHLGLRILTGGTVPLVSGRSDRWRSRPCPRTGSRMAAGERRVQLADVAVKQRNSGAQMLVSCQRVLDPLPGSTSGQPQPQLQENAELRSVAQLPESGGWRR
jgi:hypothetical protein